MSLKAQWTYLFAQMNVKEAQMAIETYTGTLDTADESEVTITLFDGDGAEVGKLVLDRETYDDYDDDVDTIIVDTAAVEVDPE